MLRVSYLGSCVNSESVADVADLAGLSIVSCNNLSENKIGT